MRVWVSLGRMKRPTRRRIGLLQFFAALLVSVPMVVTRAQSVGEGLADACGPKAAGPAKPGDLNEPADSGLC